VEIRIRVGTTMAFKALERNLPWESQRGGAGVAQVSESLIVLIVGTHKSKETVGEAGNSQSTTASSLDFHLGIREIAPGVSPVAE
jgi:hypothetical protein